MKYELHKFKLYQIQNNSKQKYMKLKDFIRQSLLDVVNGVEEANEEKDRFRLTSHKNLKTGERGQKIEFDISVIVDKSTENDLKGGIKVAFANIGGEHKEAENTQNVHKLKFEIFITESNSSND